MGKNKHKNLPTDKSLITNGRHTIVGDDLQTQQNRFGFSPEDLIL
jgi:hypothetical protein